MRRLAPLALLLLAAPAHAGHLHPGDVNVPAPCRVFNASGSQCCWCALETGGNYLRIPQITGANGLTRDHKHASNSGEMTAVLRRRGVKYAAVRTEAEIRAAIAMRLPVAIFIPGHCCLCVGLDDSGARILSNNHREREVQEWPREQWRRLYQGWGLVLYPPEGAVDEPAPARGGEASKRCQVIVQVGPRPPPPVVLDLGPFPRGPFYPPVVAPGPWWLPPAYPYAYPHYSPARYRPRPHYRPAPHHHGRHRGAAGPHGGDCPCGPECRCPDCACPPAALTAEAKATIEATAVEVRQGNAGGSGTVIDYDPGRRLMLVASAAHVFRGLGAAGVSYPGKHDSRRAEVVYFNRATDVAYLEAQADSEPVCTEVAERDPEPGAPCFKLGYPAYARGALNVRRGQVKPPHPPNWLFECSCFVQSGDSGGGIFLADGSLCSIVTGFYGPSGGRLDPTCMYGSGTAALHAGLEKLRAEGWNWPTARRKRHLLPRRRRPRNPAAPAAPGTPPPVRSPGGPADFGFS